MDKSTGHQNYKPSELPLTDSKEEPDIMLDSRKPVCGESNTQKPTMSPADQTMTSLSVWQDGVVWVSVPGGLCTIPTRA